MRHRYIRKIRENVSGPQKDEIRYYGPQARYLYFETLQLILRMQISFLMKEWNLPADFELICRDIWSLHLNLSRRPPQPEPYLVRQDGIIPQDNVERAEDGNEGEGEKENSSPELDQDKDKKAQEGELTDLLKDMSEFESSDEEENPDGTDFIDATHSARYNLRNDVETPAGNIAVLTVACWLIRVPVMYIDFIRLIEAYKLPYLEAVRLLPEGMTRHLSQASKNNLSPSNPPSVSGLHAVTSRLARNVWTKHGIHVAEMNMSWVLWRIVKRMGGDSTIYRMAKMMAVELNLPLTLNPRLAPELIREGRVHGRRMNSDNSPAEVSLMAAVILVLKLKYDFTKIASDDAEGERIAIPTGEENQDPVFLNCGKEIAMNELDDEEMDGYLDFCEVALLGRRKEDKTVGEFFPRPRAKKDKATRVSPESTTATRPAAGIIWLTDRNVAGRISIFHFADSGGTLPEPFLGVLGVAARFVGVRLEELGRVVEQFERRLVRFRSRDPENRSFS